MLEVRMLHLCCQPSTAPSYLPACVAASPTSLLFPHDLITTPQTLLLPDDNTHNQICQLQLLYIRGCENLKSLGQEMEYLTDLRHLWIVSCVSLECLPPDMKNLTALDTLFIDDCKKLELVRSGQGITGLRSFSIGQSDLEALPNWLQDSADTSQSMAILEFKNLRELPEWLQTLTLLENLMINNCPQIVFFDTRDALPHRVERIGYWWMS